VQFNLPSFSDNLQPYLNASSSKQVSTVQANPNKTALLLELATDWSPLWILVMCTSPSRPFLVVYTLTYCRCPSGIYHIMDSFQKVKIGGLELEQATMLEETKGHPLIKTVTMMLRNSAVVIRTLEPAHLPAIV